MTQQRAVISTEEIDRNPISKREIDLALHYADQEYQVEIDPDLLRMVFNTVQGRREHATILIGLVRIVVRETIHESVLKAAAFRGAIMKVYNHRRQVKAEADERKRQLGMPVAPATAQTSFPFDPTDKAQRVLV